jgi:hypothetical protein
MTMLKQIATAAAAGLGVLLGGQFASAGDDTVRLGGNIESKTTTLAYDGQSDTLLMRGVHGGIGGRGGFAGGRGGFVGGRGGFVGGRVGFVGGRGVGWGGGWRGGWGGGWGWGGYGVGIGLGGYWGGYGYYPGYWPYYGGYVYPSPAYYNSWYAPTVYYAPAYTYPISTNVLVGQAAVSRPSMSVVPGQAQQQFQPEQLTVPPVPGGQVNQVPMPLNPGVPSYQPTPNATLGDGRFVGLPAAQKLTSQGGSGFAYADGNTQATTSFATTRLGTAVTATKKN